MMTKYLLMMILQVKYYVKTNSVKREKIVKLTKDGEDYHKMTLKKKTK